MSVLFEFVFWSIMIILSFIMLPSLLSIMFYIIKWIQNKISSKTLIKSLFSHWIELFKLLRGELEE